MKKSELKQIIKEEISKTLKESMDGGSQHHIDQISDDLMYGEFENYEDVISYLDNIIRRIEELKNTEKENFQARKYTGNIT